MNQRKVNPARQECADILKLSQVECAQKLSEYLFKEERFLSLIADSWIFGIDRKSNYYDYFLNCLKDLFHCNPVLDIYCHYYEPFKTTDEKVKWRVFISLYGNENIIIDLRDTSYNIVQYLQVLMIDSFTTTDHSNTKITMSHFKHNDILRASYDKMKVIKALFQRVIQLKEWPVKNVMDDVVKSLPSEYKKIKLIWASMLPKQ